MKHDTIVNQPVIETERFVLRPLRRSDVGLIEMYAGNETVAKMTATVPHPLPPGSTEAYIQRVSAEGTSEHVWAIDGIAGGDPEIMGLIALADVDPGLVEIGYWVAPAFWNWGIASEVVSTIVENNPLNNKTMFASVFQDNPASARVLTNCGFQYIGDAESFSVARDASVATWTYSKKLD